MFNEVSGMGETKRINYYLSKLIHCVAVVIQDHLSPPASSVFHFVLLFVMLILSALQYGQFMIFPYVLKENKYPLQMIFPQHEKYCSVSLVASSSLVRIIINWYR
jgi:hypothetical protein